MIELARIAFADITDVIQVDYRRSGTPPSFRPRGRGRGDLRDPQGLRAKMHNKLAALDLLVKHVGVSNPTLRLSGTVGAGHAAVRDRVLDPASGKRRRVAGDRRAASPADGNDHGSEDLDDDVGD